MAKINSRLFPISQVDDSLITSLFEIFSRCFLQASLEVFRRDCLGKTAVLVLTQGTEVVGFSTLEDYEVQTEGGMIQVFFSGDTIILPQFWGTPEMPKALARYFFRRKEELGERRCFWFLISSGYKTYRLLPVFFRNYIPSLDPPASSNELSKIVDELAHSRFGDRYDAASGLIRLCHPTPLREGIAPLGERELRKPEVAFFLKRNPEYREGTELACLAEIERGNLTRAGRRLLSGEDDD